MSVPQFVTLLPDNQIGKECARTLRYHGVDTSCLHFKKGRMGIYFFENGASQRPSNVIYDREGAVIAAIDEKDLNWKSIFSGASWFHVSGITPARKFFGGSQRLVCAPRSREGFWKSRRYDIADIVDRAVERSPAGS